MRAVRVIAPAGRRSGWNGDAVLASAMVLPAVVALAMFQFLPLVTAVLNSLQSFGPFDRSSTGWVGLDNYRELFADPAFRYALLNTFLYIVLMLGFTIPLALLLAVLLDRRLPGSTFARNAIIGALAASEAVTALIWNQMYEPSSGLFNAILDAVSLPTQPFLTSGGQALVSIVVMSVWKDVGLPMLIFLAGLQSIPRELPEAAELDGADARQIFWYVTLPALRPSLVVALFMMTITATRMFTPILIMTQGGPQGATTNLALFSYLQGFEFQSPGTASASVVCMLVVLALVTAAQSFLLRGREAD
ncbi:sugar ABC transporter permease [Alsobacter sp. SYSU M60028]|uniref:Sugar ABC transporter permease n=1 Tax=Alsobacter ponti TaxID=2962936 RepID=A0ABT1LGB6_9HYPH|nr:sugar ABC transporter permease [Alsobacter ponti]MCP8940121.1 sugar ABC transporter permease [Alsobacter ponti]